MKPRHVAGHERDRRSRRLVDPLQVVEDDQDRLAHCLSGEHAERSHPHRESVDDVVSLLETESTSESPGLRPWELADRTLGRSKKLGERREREIGIRLAAGRAERGQAPLNALHSIVQQHGLAHSRLARDEERGALAPDCSVDERLERCSLSSAADQHTRILMDRRAKT